MIAIMIDFDFLIVGLINDNKCGIITISNLIIILFLPMSKPKPPEVIGLPEETKRFVDSVENPNFRKLILEALRADNSEKDLPSVQHLSDTLRTQKAEEFLKFVRMGDEQGASNIANRFFEDTGIVAEQLDGYREAVEQGLIASEASINFIKRFCIGIDFRNVKGFRELVTEKFLDCLRRGQEPFYQVGLELGMGIDFEHTEGYEEAVRQGFLQALRNDGNQAEEILLYHGANLNLLQMKEAKAALEQGILRNLSYGNPDGVEKLLKKYGTAATDPSKIDGYNEAVAKGLLELLKHHDLDRAIKFKNQFGRGIDFSQVEGYGKTVGELMKGFVKIGGVSVLEEIHKNFGEGSLEFDELKKAIEEGFTTALKRGESKDAVAMFRTFGDIVDFGLVEGAKEAARLGSIMMPLRYSTAEKFWKDLEENGLSFLSPGPIEASVPQVGQLPAKQKKRLLNRKPE